MSYTLEVAVKVRDERDQKELLVCIDEFNQEAVEETGNPEYISICDVLTPNPETVVVHGDPYDVGALMIRLFGANVWCGGSNLPRWTADPDGGPDVFHRGTLPVWGGRYDPDAPMDMEIGYE